MNIESVKPSTMAIRAPLPETSPKVGRPIAEEGKSEISSVATESATKSAAKNDRNKNPASSLSVEEAVKRLSSFVANTQSQINFSIDEVSGIRVVKITDSESNEVIRQFPSEEAIKIASALDQLQGLLIKDKA